MKTFKILSVSKNVYLIELTKDCSVVQILISEESLDLITRACHKVLSNKKDACSICILPENEKKEKLI